MINNLLERYPQSALLLYYKGLYFERIDDLSSALKYYDRVISRSSKVEDVHLHMAQIYYKQGNIKEAILSYKRLLSITPENRNVYKKIISLSEEENQLNKLCNEWLNVYSSNTENKLLKEYLIFALHKADRIVDAEKIIKKSE
jgi:tetratricopeptide (TPR) repeat protein